MTKSELIKEIYSNPEYVQLCKRMAGGSLGQDLYQEMLIIVIEYSEEKIIQIKCQRCWVLKILSNMWNSVTSPFYYKYKKNERLNNNELKFKSADGYEGMYQEIPDLKDSENENEDERLEKVEKELDKMYWYDQNLFRLYVESGSSRKLQKKTGIHFVSISKTVKKVKKILREKVK